MKTVLWIEQAMRLDPLGPQIAIIQANMGRAYFLQGHSDLTIDWLLKARASNPKLPRVYACRTISDGRRFAETSHECFGSSDCEFVFHRLLHRQYRNMPGLAGIGARPDHDLHVLIERSEEFHQTFDGKLVEPIIFQGRDFGLRDAEQDGDFALFQLACFE